MNGGKKIGGFTIVEVMIFLGVSGMLFIIAMTAINGKQAQSEFATGIRDFGASLEDVVNDVTTGYFPENPTDYQCGISGSGIAFNTGTSGGQGTHEKCVFLGKIINFNLSLGPTNHYDILTVGSRTTDVNSQIQNNYAAMKPVPVEDSSLAPVHTTSSTNIDNGLFVTKIISNEGSLGTPVITAPNAFGVFTSLTSQSIGNTTGALSADIVSVPGSVSSDTLSTTIGRLTSAAFVPAINPTIIICLQHSENGTGKRAIVVLGSSNRQIYTEVHIDDYAQVVNSLTGGTASC